MSLLLKNGNLVLAGLLSLTSLLSFLSLTSLLCCDVVISAGDGSLLLFADFDRVNILPMHFNVDEGDSPPLSVPRRTISGVCGDIEGVMEDLFGLRDTWSWSGTGRGTNSKSIADSV